MRKCLVVALAACALSPQFAHAGGFARGNADIDILFEDGKIVTRDSLTYVDPNKKFDKKPGVAGLVGDLDGQEYSKSYFVPSAAIKYQVYDDIACAATFTTPFGASSDYRGGMDYRGKLTENFVTQEYGLTCSYAADVGPGKLHVIGGAFIQNFDYDLEAMTRGGTGLTPLNVDLQDEAIGWRAGLGYVIPEYAFKASLMYRSKTEHSASGGAELPEFNSESLARGWGKLPQSVELKVQTGIAPGWGVFGAVKWTDWSSFEQLHLNFVGQDYYNNYFWRDGLTITGGVAHQFNDMVAVSTSLTWDRGVSTGWDLHGDTLTTALGVTVSDKWGGKLQLTGAVSWMDGVSENKYGAMNASTKDSVGYGIQAQYKISF